MENKDNIQIQYKPNERTFVERYGALILASLSLFGSGVSVYFDINNKIDLINAKVALLNKELEYIKKDVKENKKAINKHSDAIIKLDNKVKDFKYEIQKTENELRNQMFNLNKDTNLRIETLKRAKQ